MSMLYPIYPGTYRFNRIIGTGGIGSGIFFSFDREDPPGRNESYSAQLLPYKDYCKQHIILHYVAILLGARDNNFEVYPIGTVGNDDTGKSLVDYMKSVGMYTAHVQLTGDAATLFSVCYQYPDKSGGNITMANSASNLVSVTDIENFFRSDAPPENKSIVLSVPEVPLAPRIKLLEEGRKRNYLNVSSVLSAETVEFRKMGGFALTGLLSVNIDEAARIVSLNADENDHQQIIKLCIDELVKDNPRISILITLGSKGVYCYSDNQLVHYPAFKVNPISTAGAGDAFIAGTISGLCCGLRLSEKTDDGNLNDAVQLGLLLAALTVTSADTIHAKADAEELQSFARSLNLPFSNLFHTMFNNK